MTDNHDNHHDNADDLEQVWHITMPIRKAAGDPCDLGWLFLCWAWEAGYGDWDQAVRALARALRGLERIGLIERRTIRRNNAAAHHGFVITDEGRAALAVLSGQWISGGGR